MMKLNGQGEKVLVMRIFLTVLILIFSLQSWTKADDIRDFEIEGISIGDSLLDYLSKERIKNEEKFFYKSKKFASIYIKKSSYSPLKLEIYDTITFSYKPNDKKYIIYSIDASISYKNNIEDCYNQKKIIENELSDLLNIELNSYKTSYSGDPSGESKVSISDLIFGNGGASRVICYDISQKLSDEKGWWDRLSVIINSDEFNKFLQNDAY